MIPLVRSVGYVYNLEPSVFFNIFCNDFDTSGMGVAEVVASRPAIHENRVGDLMMQGRRKTRNADRRQGMMLLERLTMRMREFAEQE